MAAPLAPMAANPASLSPPEAMSCSRSTMARLSPCVISAGSGVATSALTCDVVRAEVGLFAISL